MGMYIYRKKLKLNNKKKQKERSLLISIRDVEMEGPERNENLESRVEKKHM
jgi:hypothetical protein